MNLFKTNWFLLIILSAIWGGAFTLNKLALDFYTPEVIVAGRLISGSIFLVVLVYFMYKRFTISFSELNYYLFMSLVGIVIPFIAIINKSSWYIRIKTPKKDIINPTNFC